MVNLEFRLDRLTAAIASIAALVTALMGGWTQAMTVLVVFLCLDFALGTVRSAIQGRLSSATSIKKTGVKIVLLWALVTFAAQLDKMLGTNAAWRDAVVVFFTVAQATSIVENAVPIAQYCGWQVPPFLTAALEQLSTKSKNDAP